jgi:outer membrane protein
MVLPGVKAQDTLTISYEDAIIYALGESYTIRSHGKLKEASQHYYQYYKAMFKPRFDLELGIPVWEEYVNRIEVPDGLPVYNSYGSMMLNSDLSFKYILPSGGNISLSTNLYRQNLTTILASDNEKLKNDLFYSRFWISLSQPLFTKNQLRENLREAEFRYMKTAAYFTRAQMDIVYRVTQEFYKLYETSVEYEIARERLTNSKESFRIARLKTESGRIPQADLLSEEVSMYRDEANLLRAQNAMNNEEDNFKQLVGIDLQKKVRIITDLNYSTFVIDENKALEEALKNRLEITEQNMDINLQQITVDRAKREREFKGNLSAYYDLTGISTLETSNTWELAHSSIEDISNRPPNRGLMLTFSFPIYDWGRGKERVKEANLNLEEKQLSLEDTKITITREVREVIRTVNESREQIKIHEKNLERARKTYRISQKRFENGDISSQELVIERERLADVQLEYLNAFITYQMAVNDLKRKTMWDFENNRTYLIEEGK